MNEVKVSVSIPDRRKFNEVLQEAKSVGLQVNKSFDRLGVVTGVIKEDALTTLKQVHGIGSVEKDRTYTTV